MDKRFVLSAVIEGKEVIRKAVYAPDAYAVTKMDIFSDDEFTMLIDATEHKNINIKIVETAR